MGQFPSYLHGTPLEKGGVEELRAIFGEWRDGGYEFSVGRKDFGQLFGPHVSQLAEKRIWQGHVVEGEGGAEQGTLFPLELLASLTMQVKGLARDRIAFLFALFDMAQGQSLSKDELGWLLMTVLTNVERGASEGGGDAHESRQPPPPQPSSSRIDLLLDHAWKFLKKGPGGYVSLSELNDWIENGLNLHVASNKVTLSDLRAAVEKISPPPPSSSSSK